MKQFGDVLVPETADEMGFLIGMSLSFFYPMNHPSAKHAMGNVTHFESTGKAFKITVEEVPLEECPYCIERETWKS